MQLSEYTIARETVLVEATATLEKSFEVDPTVTLVCTDSRVVFSDGSVLTDIRHDSIDEIRVSSPTALNRYAGWAFLFAASSLLTYVLLGRVPPPADLAIPAAVVLLVASVLAVGLAITRAKWRVVLRTPQSTYRFVGDDESLTNVPHAVRGAV